MVFASASHICCTPAQFSRIDQPDSYVGECIFIGFNGNRQGWIDCLDFWDDGKVSKPDRCVHLTYGG